MKSLSKLDDHIHNAQMLVECAYMACRDLDDGLSRFKAEPIRFVLDLAADELAELAAETEGASRVEGTADA